MSIIQKHFKTGDRVITTRGNEGEVEVVYKDVEFLDINYENYLLDSTKPYFLDENGNRAWTFIDENNQEAFLIENAHFKFRNKYKVKFDRNTSILNGESLRLFDKPYQLITVKDKEGNLKSFIVCNNHKPEEGIYVSARILTP